MATNEELKGLMGAFEGNPSEVEEVTLMTMTVFKRYPNGNTYIDYKKSKSWIQGMQKVQRTKAKLRKSSMKKADEVVIGEEEVY